MSVPASELRERFIGALMNMELDVRYYAFFEAHRSALGKMMRLQPGVVISALEAEGMPARHHRRERFYSHAKQLGEIAAVLKMSVSHSLLELIMHLHGPGGILGGPVHVLAKEVGEFRDPGFRPVPAYPKLPFSSERELAEAIGFTSRLFADFQQAVLGDTTLRGWIGQPGA
jgi:hypothetical protein